MEWLRRLLGMQSPRDTLLLEQSRTLADLCRKQQETLDRIVAARYDRPALSNSTPPERSSMPSYMMSDQPDLGTALTVDSDAEFMRIVNG